MANILLAEDEASVREFVSRMLALHGHTVTEAEDGAVAAEYLAGEQFDMLLTDIKMPVMDGITLALKAKDTHPDMPVLLMTGYADESQRAQNLSALIEGLLQKPFNKDQLMKAVADTLGGGEANNRKMSLY